MTDEVVERINEILDPDDLVLENIDKSNLAVEIFENSDLGNSELNINHSKDVVIGNIAQFHGPVTIIQKPRSIDEQASCSNIQNQGEGRLLLFVKYLLYITSIIYYQRTNI